MEHNINRGSIICTSVNLGAYKTLQTLGREYLENIELIHAFENTPFVYETVKTILALVNASVDEIVDILYNVIIDLELSLAIIDYYQNIDKVTIEDREKLLRAILRRVVSDANTTTVRKIL